MDEIYLLVNARIKKVYDLHEIIKLKEESHDENF